MAENKKSFLLYADQIHTFEELSDEEAGKLVKHLFRYVNDQDPVAPDKLTKIAFEPIKQQLKRDLVKWEEELAKKSESGVMGNLKRWHLDIYNKVLTKELTLEAALEMAKQSSHPDRTQSHPIANIAVNGTVTVTDTEKNTNTGAKALVGTADQYAKLSKDIQSITKFIKDYRPKFIEPYSDLWNFFCDKYGTQKVAKVSESRKKQLKVRLSDKNFDFPGILKAATDQKFALEGSWFTFDWLVKNDNNYIKILEKQYLKTAVPAKPEAAGLSAKLLYE